MRAARTSARDEQEILAHDSEALDTGRVLPRGLLRGSACAGPAFAQSADRVAAHTDWSVFVAGAPKECYIVSPPKSSAATRDGKPTEVQRGDIRLFVAFRPGENVANEVSFTGGYPFREGSTVTLAVGADSFTLTPRQRRRRRVGLDRPGRRQQGGGGAEARRHAPSSPAPRRAAPAPRTPSRSRASPPRSRTPRRAAASRRCRSERGLTSFAAAERSLSTGR